MAGRRGDRGDKFDVGARFSMPAFDDLVPAGGRVERTAAHLESRYFDTAERDLLASGVTLRRRLGDTVAGWQLNVPEGSARTEVRLPGDGDAVPDELIDLVRGIGSGRPLAEIARVRTERRIARLRAPDGSTALEVADDTVHAAALGANAVLTEWREIDVHLGSGRDQGRLDEVRARLIGAGACRSTGSELARALDASARGPAADGTTGSLVAGYLRRQHAELVAGDIALRQHRDAVHSTRVAARRIRSTLRIFRPLFDDRRATRLDADLSWYSTLLGDVRDRQVQRRRFADAIDQLPEELVVRSFADDIDEWLGADQRARRRELDAALCSERYLPLLREVRDLAAAPFTAGADDAPSTVERLARRARTKADKRLRRIDRLAESDDATIDAAMHRARKAARRARYAVELVAPVSRPKRTKKIIKRYKKAQKVLGEHQDAVVATTLLRDHAVGAHVPPPFTYGLLLAREDALARSTRRRADAGHRDLAR